MMPPLPSPTALDADAFGTSSATSHLQLHCQGEGRPAQLQACKSFAGHIFCPNFGYGMDTATALTLEIRPSRTDHLGILAGKMDFVSTTGCSGINRLQFIAGFDRAPSTPWQDQPVPVPWLEDKCPALPLSSWKRRPGSSFLQGRAVPPAHPEPHPLPHARGHHVTCHFSHCPRMSAGWHRQRTSASTPHPPALVGSMQGRGDQALLLTMARQLLPSPSTG